MAVKKGNIPWNKDKKGLQVAWNKGLTKETDKRVKVMSEKHKGQKRSKEAKQRMSIAQTGKIHTKEHNRNISDKLKGKEKSDIHRRNISKANEGKCLSKEIRDKIRDTLKGKYVGENHPNWQGGITPKNTKIRNSDEYKDWRDIIYKRDNYTCQLCNMKGCYLNAHHILPFCDFLKLRMAIENGITLCKKCHYKTKFKEYNYVNQSIWKLNGNQELIELFR